MELSVDREAILLPSDVDIECSIAVRIRSLPGVSEPIPGFGSSDCRCRSHLFLLDDPTYNSLKWPISPPGAQEGVAWSSGSAALIR
jgi:Uri superfamily endonuclease